MVEKLLAVVGDEQDEGVVVEPGALQLLQEAAELPVAVGDLPVVLGHHPLPVEGLVVVGAGVLGRVALGGVGLEHPVEGRRGDVRDVGVHGVHVDEGRQPLPGGHPLQRGVHHHVGVHQLAPSVVFPVKAGEEVEAGIEGRLRPVDHRVGDGGPGGPPLLVEPPGQGHVGRVEGVAQLDRAVLAGQARREDRGHRGLGPGGVGDRLLEDHRVGGEGVELGGGAPVVAVDPGVVRPQGVDQVDDGQRRRVSGHGQRRGAPPRPVRLAGLLVAPGLEDQLPPPAGVRGQVHVHRHPAAVVGLREGVQEAAPHQALLRPLAHLDEELHGRAVVEAGVDGAAHPEVGPGRDVHREAEGPGRSRGVPAEKDVVQPETPCAGGEHLLEPLVSRPGLDGGGRAERAGRRAPGGGHRPRPPGPPKRATTGARGFSSVEQATVARAFAPRQTRRAAAPRARRGPSSAGVLRSRACPAPSAVASLP